MSMSGAQNNQHANEDRSDSLARRTRRAFTAVGWLGVLLGAALGYLQADPDLIAGWLPFAAAADVVTLLGMMLLGVISAVILNWWLSGTTKVLRFMLALLTVLIAVISHEIMRGLLLRIGLRESLLSFSDLLEGAEILVGALGALIGIRLGRRTLLSDAEVAAEAGHSTPQRRNGRTTSTTSRARSQRQPAQRQRQQRPETRTTTSERRQIMVEPLGSAATAGGLSIQPSRPSPAKPVRKSRPKRRGLGRRVHLGRQETSVCPYCLEQVLPRDPRGRVVCRICHTAHHGDCWAITGKCEVPHLQT